MTWHDMTFGGAVTFNFDFPIFTFFSPFLTSFSSLSQRVKERSKERKVKNKELEKGPCLKKNYKTPSPTNKLCKSPYWEQKTKPNISSSSSYILLNMEVGHWCFGDVLLPVVQGHSIQCKINGIMNTTKYQDQCWLVASSRKLRLGHIVDFPLGQWL